MSRAICTCVFTKRNKRNRICAPNHLSPICRGNCVEALYAYLDWKLKAVTPCCDGAAHALSRRPTSAWRPQLPVVPKRLAPRLCDGCGRHHDGLHLWRAATFAGGQVEQVAVVLGMIATARGLAVALCGTGMGRLTDTMYGRSIHI